MSAPSTPPPMTDPRGLHEAMLKRVHRRLTAEGSLVLPAAPALLDTYVEMLVTQFRALGRNLDDDELAFLRRVLSDKLHEGYESSPFCRLHVSWSTDAAPAVSLSYVVSIIPSTMESEYQEWVDSREPPLFGSHPDAKVMDVARSLGPPAKVRCLDIGAGTGRNTIPLAREGFPTDAVEAAAALVPLLRDAVARDGLDVRIFEGDVLDPSVALPKSHYRLVFLCEVLSHFRSLGDVRKLLTRAAHTLAPGGLLLFSAFVADDAYAPDPLARELSQVFWSSVFTRKELAGAMQGLPFALLSDESVHDYEKAHLPPAAWPPTGWFTEWTQGRDVYALPEGKCPIELRWVAFRRT
jgi:2-polyprenyl-3-methyl-5-hydroxy-6-metoxy-1,4-benzoquinol methylase